MRWPLILSIASFFTCCTPASIGAGVWAFVTVRKSNALGYGTPFSGILAILISVLGTAVSGVVIVEAVNETEAQNRRHEDLTAKLDGHRDTLKQACEMAEEALLAED